MNNNDNNDNNENNKDIISINELNDRLNKLKRSKYYEISQNITNDELNERLNKLKDQINNKITDKELLLKLNEIYPDSIIITSDNNQNNLNNINLEDQNDNENNLKLTDNNDNNNNIEDELDDFEFFLAEAGISDKIISRVSKELNNNNLNQKQQEFGQDDGNIIKLENNLNNTDDFSSQFLNENDSLSNDSELNHVINQAKDELRLLPNNNINNYQYFNDSISMNELQDTFDTTDPFDENQEIQRIVSEAQDLARLQKKYGTHSSSSSSSSKNNNQNKKKTSSLTSFGVDSDRSYYYSIQAQDKYNETKHKSKKKNNRNNHNDDYDDNSDYDNSSDDGRDSY